MTASKKMQKGYEKKGINFIYIDDNPAAWEKAANQIGLNEKESYLLPKGNDSDFSRKNKITSIPRYLLIDKNGKVIDSNAPRPSDPNLKELFDKLLDGQ
jgi:hypothetical protein